MVILAESFPSRERGLKLVLSGLRFGEFAASFPSRERGLKLGNDNYYAVQIESFPSRERGLKL